MEVLKIKKVQENAVIPKRATEGSAGLDLCACIDAPLTLNSGDTALIPTGLAIELPSSQYGAFVFARSGLSIKHGIGLLNAVGVIDSDYRGEIKVGVMSRASALRSWSLCRWQRFRWKKPRRSANPNAARAASARRERNKLPHFSSDKKKQLKKLP